MAYALFVPVNQGFTAWPAILKAMVAGISQILPRILIFWIRSKWESFLPLDKLDELIYGLASLPSIYPLRRSQRCFDDCLWSILPMEESAWAGCAWCSQGVSFYSTHKVFQSDWGTDFFSSIAVSVFATHECRNRRYKCAWFQQTLHQLVDSCICIEEFFNMSIWWIRNDIFTKPLQYCLLNVITFDW